MQHQTGIHSPSDEPTVTWTDLDAGFEALDAGLLRGLLAPEVDFLPLAEVDLGGMLIGRRCADRRSPSG